MIEPSPRSYNTALCDDEGLLLGHLMVVAETLHYNGSGETYWDLLGDLGRPEPGNQAVCGCPRPARDSQFNKVDTRDTKFQMISRRCLSRKLAVCFLNNF